MAGGDVSEVNRDAADTWLVIREELQRPTARLSGTVGGWASLITSMNRVLGEREQCGRCGGPHEVTRRQPYRHLCYRCEAKEGPLKTNPRNCGARCLTRWRQLRVTEEDAHAAVLRVLYRWKARPDKTLRLRLTEREAIAQDVVSELRHVALSDTADRHFEETTQEADSWLLSRWRDGARRE